MYIYIQFFKLYLIPGCQFFDILFETCGTDISHNSAEMITLFKEGDMMSLDGCDSGSFHSGRAASNYNNIFRLIRFLNCKADFFHCLWIDGTAKFCMFVPDSSYTVFIASQTWTDIFRPSLH